jgi:hypothetical protein
MGKSCYGYNRTEDKLTNIEQMATDIEKHTTTGQSRFFPPPHLPCRLQPFPTIILHTHKIRVPDLSISDSALQLLHTVEVSIGKPNLVDFSAFLGSRQHILALPDGHA